MPAAAQVPLQIGCQGLLTDTLDGMDASAFGDITGVVAGEGLKGGGTSGTVTVSADTGYLQRRVFGSCAVGSSIRAIAADGAVTCEADDNSGGDITGVTAGAGLTGGGTSGTVTVSTSFAGSGTATTVARSDHDHAGLYYSKAYVDALESRIQTLEALLAGVMRTGNEVTFSGVNVRTVNGNGSTNGAINGLGNLIVGYDEARPSGSDKSGSHNIVVGRNHNYASCGGLVAGYYNTIAGEFASVSGGFYNTADNAYASVSGGQNNTASGEHAFIGGGGAGDDDGNIAFADYSAILGGLNNLTGDGERDLDSGGYELTGGTDHGIGVRATVSGGHRNWVAGMDASASGGYVNTAAGNWAGVSGRVFNSAQGNWSSVSGGESNSATSLAASVSGGKNNLATGSYASVSGGHMNAAGGNASSVSGGNTRSVIGEYDWRAGGLFQDN